MVGGIVMNKWQLWALLSICFCMNAGFGDKVRQLLGSKKKNQDPVTFNNYCSEIDFKIHLDEKGNFVTLYRAASLSIPFDFISKQLFISQNEEEAERRLVEFTPGIKIPISQKLDGTIQIGSSL